MNKEYRFSKTKDGTSVDCGYMRIMDSSEADESAELYFYGDICGSSFDSRWLAEDKAPQDVSDFLHALDKKKRIDVYVNSGGGDVFGGIAIYNILSRYEGETVAHIDGIAASIAGIIPFACDRVIAKPSAQIMLHKPWTGCFGNADDMKKCIEALDACEQSIVDIYSQHAVNGTTTDKIKQMIDRETWLTCEQAAQYFSIELEHSEQAPQACVSDLLESYKNTPSKLLQRSKETDEQSPIKEKLQLELEALSCTINRKKVHNNDKD